MFFITFTENCADAIFGGEKIAESSLRKCASVFGMNSELF